MKNLLRIIILLFILTSCNNNKANNNNTSLAQYFFSEVNTKYTYSMPNGDNLLVYYIYKDDNFLQRISMTESSKETTTYTELFEITNDSVNLVDFKSEIALTKLPGSDENNLGPMLKKPIELNSSWLNEKINLEFTITNVSVNVKVPYGEFDCIEVSAKDLTSNIVTEKYYFAKDIGLLKQVYTSEVEEKVDDVVVSETTSESISELISIDKNININVELK